MIENAKENAQSFLAKAKLIHLATVSEEGQPFVRALLPVKVDSFDVYMTTSKSSNKIKHTAANSKVCLYTLRAENMMDLESIQIFGDLEIVDNEATKNEMWRDEWQMYYKGGKEDPEYSIIKVNAKEIMYAKGMDYEGFDV